MMFEQLEELAARYAELERLTVDPEIIKDTPQYTRLLKEQGRSAKLVLVYQQYCQAEKARLEAEEMAQDESESELRQMAVEEAALQTKKRKEFEDILRDLLVDNDEDSHKNAIVEIRAGTGGTEAALFARDLFHMYATYAETKSWKLEVISQSTGDLDGLKEIVFSVEGNGVFERLRFESGGHRIQRVPETETQGRIHTSLVTVAVLPEAEEVEIKIDPAELRIDVCRSSGPGGQSVNTTDSAVRITHLPTQLVVQCQDEKSQHKNKAKAMKVLRSRLFDHFRKLQDKERGDTRRAMIGSGDRSERIRTYNVPQNRVTDHRVEGLSLYALERILTGGLDPLLDPLLLHVREERLKQI